MLSLATTKPETSMLVYLVDDRGSRGEYANFLHAYVNRLPRFELQVFTHWASLLAALNASKPDCILVDMRFDETPREQLYGDIEALANTDQFCGNLEGAEAQIRGMQGLLIVRAIRDHGSTSPIVLFGNLPSTIRAQVIAKAAPLDVLEGLIFDELRVVLEKCEPTN